MFNSFQARVTAARQSDQLFFAALLPQDRIASAFRESSVILDSARVYTTAVTVWTFLSQVLSSDQSYILHLLGLDHEKLTYRYSGRDFRLTDS